MDFATIPFAWQVCAEEAWDAFLLKTVPIGACLIGEDGTLISRGRNHIYDHEPTNGVPPAVALHKLAHAELNCLLGAKTIRGATIYSTVEPCPLCMGAIYMTGVRNTQYAVPDPYAGSTNLLETTWYLSVKKAKAAALDFPDYTTIMSAWNFYFFFFEKVRRGEDWFTEGIVINKWKDAMPEAHALAAQVWQQYPEYNGPFMRMDATNSIAFWASELNELRSA